MSSIGNHILGNVMKKREIERFRFVLMSLNAITITLLLATPLLSEHYGNYFTLEELVIFTGIAAIIFCLVVSKVAHHPLTNKLALIPAMIIIPMLIAAAGYWFGYFDNVAFAEAQAYGISLFIGLYFYGRPHLWYSILMLRRVDLNNYIYAHPSESMRARASAKSEDAKLYAEQIVLQGRRLTLGEIESLEAHETFWRHVDNTKDKGC